MLFYCVYRGMCENFKVREADVEHVVAETLKHAPNKPGGKNFIKKW